MISKILVRLGVLAVGIFLAAYLVPGISFTGYGPLIAGAVLLGLLNISIKPLLILFTLVVNGFLLWAVGQFITGLSVAGFLPSRLGAAIISVFSIFINRLV